MTRKELFETIEKYHLGYKVKQITDKNYTNCSNATLEEIVIGSVGSKLQKEEPKPVVTEKETTKTKKTVIKKSEPIKEELKVEENSQSKEEPKPKKKTIEELLAEIDSKVDSYRHSSDAIIKQGKELEYYSKIIKSLRNNNNQFCIANFDYKKCVIDPEHVQYCTLLDREKQYVFKDKEFVRDILICILNERIEKISASINATKEEMAKL